jgi:hypothetical protein
MVRRPVDTSFIEPFRNYLEGRSDSSLDSLLSTEAAQKTHTHAIRFGNTELNLREFWRDLISKMNEQRVEARLKMSLSFLADNEELVSEALKEVLEYLPPDIGIECRVLGMVGYDIGIVSEGTALLNLTHPLFEEDPRELTAMAMHELHHVGYTKLNPIYDLSNLKRVSDLVRIIKYSTHLEGMAVYAPLKRRVEMEILTHPDYSVLLNDIATEHRIQTYQSVLTDLQAMPDRPLEDEDFKTLEVMSGQDQRLWYIAGAHMARVIDSELGRRALVKTVTAGPDSFLKMYSGISRD